MGESRPRSKIKVKGILKLTMVCSTLRATHPLKVERGMSK